MEFMKLNSLFHGLDVVIKGDGEKKITGICGSSKHVAPGHLFIAKKGREFNGANFIKEAFKQGAAAVLTDTYYPFLKITQVIYSDLASLEVVLASRYYNFPSNKLCLIGITGTNGKTTTAYLLHDLLSTKQSCCGLMSTIDTVIGTHRFPSVLTTPDLLSNYRFLHEMVLLGAQYAVMEVSSHALDQGRVQGLDFDVGIFTNLGRDHLDYHVTSQAYLEAKAKLFALLQSPHHLAVINQDDQAASYIISHSFCPIITYGMHKQAMVRFENAQLTLDGTEFEVIYHDHRFLIQTSLIGYFNIFNCLAAMSVALSKGLTVEEIQKKLRHFKGVPGRLEKIPNSKGIHLFVDFAHTPEAMREVLQTLHQLKQGKIITIFGCGGNRDRGKRAQMARAAEKFSDYVIITSDNPRFEDPVDICQEVAVACDFKRCFIEIDRKKAIQRGIVMAEQGDIVCIAGRGAERFQNIAGSMIPFDDRNVAREICFH